MNQSAAHIAVEITRLAMAISMCGIREVFTEYSGHIGSLDVRVYPAGQDWGIAPEQLTNARELSYRVYLKSERAVDDLLTIRDRLDAIFTGEAA